MSEIAGNNVLITGGANGIGRLMALKLARLGGNIVIWDIDEDRTQQVVQELKAAGNGRHAGYRCDVSQREEIYRQADAVKAEVGPVDILINNAGVVSGSNFLEIDDDKIERTFRINSMAMFWTAKSFLPGMMERNRGHVVTVASAAGLIGVAKLADYSASKFAAFGFDESLRVELKKNAPGVKTTVVCPYYIDTGMFDGVKTRFSFLLPILKEETVADKIVKAIKEDRQRLFLPPAVHLVPLLRALPPSAFDLVSNMLGVNVSMDEFVGHKR